MKPVHLALAILTAVLWGLNFVVIKVGLGSYPPLLFTALRFTCAAGLVLFLPRPRVPWPRLVLLGAVMFASQFSCLFLGMAHGMPPGLASVTAQTQAFLTILFAAAVLRERPSAQQLLGTLVAFGGLGLIASTVGGDVTWVGLLFTLGAATSWATGNILLKRVGEVDMLPLVGWMALVPPLPLTLLSLAVDGPDRVFGALLHPTWIGAGAVLFNGLFATVVGFGIWAHLLRRYPVATVAPFSLLVPTVGMASSAWVFGEHFGPVRLGGALLILVGLGIVVSRLPRQPAPASDLAAEVSDTSSAS
jgi:O-acetylserine/cysteine efflux transporter